MIKTRIRALTFSDHTIIYCPEREVDLFFWSYWKAVSYKVYGEGEHQFEVAVVHPTYQEAQADIDQYLESKKPKPKPKTMKVVVINEEIIGYPK